MTRRWTPTEDGHAWRDGAWSADVWPLPSGQWRWMLRRDGVALRTGVAASLGCDRGRRQGSGRGGGMTPLRIVHRELARLGITADVYAGDRGLDIDTGDETTAARLWDRLVTAGLRARRVVGDTMVEVIDG